jgi:hypothetical protein
MKYIIFLIFAICVNAQLNNTIASARALSLAGATVSDPHFSMPAYTNPAILGLDHDNFIYLDAKIPYSEFDIFKVGSFSAVYSIKDLANLAFTSYFFQVKYKDIILESENLYTLSHGFKLMSDISSSVYFGYNLHLYSLTFNNYNGSGKSESSMESIVDIALYANLYKTIHMGFMLKNLGSTHIGIANEFPLLRELQFGLSYSPYDGVMTSFAFSKEDEQDYRNHFGVDYQIFEENEMAVFFRAGVVSNPNQFSLGFGLNYTHFNFHYAYMTHPMDATHQFALSINLEILND